MGKKDTKVIITVSVSENSYETAKLLAARKETTLDSIFELSLEELIGNNKELLNNPTPNLVQHQEKNKHQFGLVIARQDVKDAIKRFDNAPFENKLKERQNLIELTKKHSKTAIRTGDSELIELIQESEQRILPLPKRDFQKKLKKEART